MQAWQSFISTQTTKGVAKKDFICDLDALGLILVTGEDAEDFLQNQLSNDISQLTRDGWQYSSFSSAKGRMYAIFRVFRIDNGFILLTPKSIQQDVMQRLQKYVLMAKVQLADANQHFARFAVSADDESLKDLDAFPGQDGVVQQSDSLIVLSIDSLADQPRFLVLGLDAAEMQGLWQKLSEKLAIADPDSWRLTEILAGTPVVYPQTSEAFVLQMTNLDRLSGVSFKKGCYPGQEIVARMHYLGKLKRRMYQAVVETDLCPQPGDELMRKDADTPAGNGKVVDAVLDSSGLCHLTYVAQIDAAEADALCLADQPEKAFRPQDLPYPLSD